MFLARGTTPSLASSMRTSVATSGSAPSRSSFPLLANPVLGFTHRGEVSTGNDVREREQHGQDRIEIERHRARERA